MECQHCEKGFSDISEFEDHSLWHTQRQEQLQRRPRTYRTNERPGSASTDRTASSKSDGSAHDSPASATTVESPPRPSKNNSSALTTLPMTFTDHNIPDFDFNFDTISPISPASSQSLPIIKTLEDVVARFPAFEIAETGDRSHPKRDYKCADCEAIFSTQKDCDLHNQSRFCPGSAAIAFALYRDVRQPGGYRIDKKYLPFNGQHSSIKCQKCHLSFANRVSKRVHERTHPAPHLECQHCQKFFSTTTELESHYQWHDDMEYRHHRDKCRRKLPGLKLQTKTLQKRSSRAGVADFGRKSVFLADEELAAIPEDFGDESAEQVNNSGSEQEVIAISFVSPEDLERTHAPNGFFREVEPGYLHPQKEKDKEKEQNSDAVAEALDALEGKSVKSQESSTSPASPAANHDLVRALKADDGVDGTRPPTGGFKKRSSLRDLFRRTRSEPQLETSLKTRSSFRKTFRRDSIANGPLAFDGRLMLSAMLQRVSTAANKGDLKTVRKECDRLMALAPPSGSDAEATMAPVHAFGFPEGTLIQDAAGNSRYVSSKTVDEITSALRHTPVASWAKTKVSVLSTRAYLSTQEELYSDAFWCYRQVLDLLREHPMLFPDVIWHAAVLSNLARLSARLDRPDDEERYYLKALAISYNRYGRRDLNNTNFLRALAASYEKNEKGPKAAEVYKRSLFARMEISGPEDSETFMAEQELAAVFCKQGRLSEAKLLYEQCLAGFESQLGMAHKITLLIVDRLCNTYIQLQAYEAALALYVRAFPHLQAVFEPDEEIPRTWLSHYVQHTKSYDFPPEVLEFLQNYRTHPTEGNLWVIQGLARVYMLAGLVADASENFEFVYEARRKIQGDHEPATLDALHGHCLALECMDDIDAATNAYNNLAQSALRSADSNNGKTRAAEARARLRDLQERKRVLAGEKEAWGLKTKGPCGTCRYETSLLCQQCQISRFCCEACRDLASRSHRLACHPSVTLCQSKSVSAIPSVPQRIERGVIQRLSQQSLRQSQKATLFRVSNSFTFSYDPRNFTTFRVKFNSQVDTFVSFERDADIRFATINPSPSTLSTTTSTTTTTVKTSAGGSKPPPPPAPNTLSTHLLVASRLGDGSAAPSPAPSSRTSIDETEVPISVGPKDEALDGAASQDGFRWTNPRETETLLLPKGKDVYLVVAPGETLLRETIRKRRQIRARDFSFPFPEEEEKTKPKNQNPLSSSSSSSSSSPFPPSNSSSSNNTNTNTNNAEKTNKDEAAETTTNARSTGPETAPFVPTAELIHYSQGLVLQGMQKKRFCYLVEVES